MKQAVNMEEYQNREYDLQIQYEYDIDANDEIDV